MNVAQEVLDDLARRLAHVRLPHEQAGADWDTGTPLSFVSRLLAHWRDRFDWRGWEARINGFDNRLVEVDGETVHVLVEKGSGGDPLPLILTNGWPGSFLEFLDIVDVLAHPERHGAPESEAFTVIVPSLPGYGMSPAPAAPISPARVAGLWSALARDRFGLDRFGAFGSDWGSLVTAEWAIEHPAGLRGILLTTPGGTPYLDANSPPLSVAEMAWQQAVQSVNLREAGYQAVQGTKPQSLAYAHADSPVALAAWIAEKFRGWSIADAIGDPPIAMDDLIANVMLYWVNGATAPMWLYLFLRDTQASSARPRPSVPAGFLLAAGDLIPPAPREWIARGFDVARYTIADAGGHFPGYDNSAMLVQELRYFFRPLR